ncbi:hypothetical protein [Spirosoma sp. KNUC1025]|uniref:hypothetical protein n=1 Tax=Spirosoma sp. KNUC1025 TaxID=2894082 RepID=UPI0038660A5E|nr:hypothetical protein LN737_23405 [Spirosoma sp. KNUC1025]
MKLKPVLDEIQHELHVLTGDEAKHKTYSSEQTFADEQTALEAFARSKEKLFDVNTWSDLSSFTADFVLYDQTGNRVTYHPPKVGDYIEIDLPGPTPKNWVQVIDVTDEETKAEFTVRPSTRPQPDGQAEGEKIEHFFQSKATSTFRIERDGCTIKAYEIGRNEAINNQGPESGDRAIINTFIAEAGWLFHQPIQWKVLTDYLVHLPL